MTALCPECEASLQLKDILTGEIMTRAGITKALIDFPLALMGKLKGGLGYVTVTAAVFLSGVSGSATADAAALGSTVVPAMRDKGYSNVYASTLICAASVIGPIIPPSIIMIFYSAMMGPSVPALFVAGVVPGLLLAMVLFGANFYYARRDNHPGGGPDDDLPRLWPAFLHALPALSLPVIVLGGMVFGVVTPTEAAALAVVAAIAVGLYYGGLSWKGFYQALQYTAALTGAIFIILGAVSCFEWLAGHEQLPQRLAGFVTELELDLPMYLLIMNLAFLIAGTFLEPPIALALLVPLLAKPALLLGADPVHLGIVLCVNLTIGMITPPVGGALLVVSAVTKVEYWSLCRAIMPFAAIEAVLLLTVITYVPEISLYLPRLFGLI